MIIKKKISLFLPLIYSLDPYMYLVRETLTRKAKVNAGIEAIVLFLKMENGNTKQPSSGATSKQSSVLRGNR